MWSIFTGFGLVSVSCIIIAFAKNMWLFYLSQLLGGVGNMLLMSLLMAMTIRTVPMERKSTAMGLFQALYGIGMTAGPMLIGRIVDAGSYATAYYMTAGLGTFAMVSALFIMPWLMKQKIS